MDIIEEKLNDNSTITANSKQLEILKSNFPQCFDKEGNFIAHKMEEIVRGSGLELSRESYSLNWLGKSYARLLANENPLTMLKEDKTHNSLEANKTSQNLLIKGDNLEVLKHLKNAYESAIKMIYIDPPYNTGGDGFVYSDDRKFTIDELSQLAGVSFEEAKRIMDFTTSNSHSAWLTFMYPRLYIARELMREDGVIFISIDDNEASQLKLLCDEVFGEENFVANVIWEKKYTVANDAKWFSDNHDHILIYAKNKEIWRPNLLNRTKEMNLRYSNPDNHKKGIWKATPLYAKSGSDKVEPFSYTFKNGVRWSPPTGTYPRFSKETLAFLDKNNEIWFGKNGDSIPSKKTFLCDLKTKGLVPRTIWKYNEVGHNHEAREELKNLFNGNSYFDTPKPTKLISQILKLSTKDNDLILDFFAGSGTTAHAVMDLNAQDGGNRKFILAQLPELTDSKSEAYKAGYKTIFDITKERILRASAKIKSEIAQDITKDNNDYDLGFKIFETTPLLENPLDTMDAFDEETPTLFDVSTLTDDDFEALLTTWKVHDGMPLTNELQKITLANYKAYYGDKKLYFVHTGFDTEDLKALILRLDEDKSFQPNKLIIFGYSFDSKYQREISEALSNYTNKKSIELNMIVRY